MLPNGPIADGIDLRPVQVRHLPVIREAIDRLGIYDTTLDCLPADPRMVANDADCLAVMILNILHGRVALYKMGDWLRTTDVDVIVGEGCPPSAFSDARLADTRAARRDRAGLERLSRYISRPPWGAKTRLMRSTSHSDDRQSDSGRISITTT